jgi:DNA-binding NtrC family response regulator
MKGVISNIEPRSLSRSDYFLQRQSLPAMQPHRRISPQTVLLVDDDPDLLISLSDALRFWLAPLTIEGYLSPYDALHALREAPDRYQVIATDFRMPQMDGVTFLRGVRRLCPNIPTILMTAYDLGSCYLDTSTVGAYETIRKPFEREEMIALFERALHFTDQIRTQRIK